MTAENHYTIQSIEHLGLVAKMIDELQIVELIDRLIPQDRSQRNLSVGECVKVMILNGLGFTNHRLYLTASFFENKPLAQLIRPGVEVSHLNDDILGRALDTVHEYGLNALFVQISRQVTRLLGLQPKLIHADSTTFHVDGAYNREQEQVEEGLIHLTKGYSRDHRPDLNQLTLNLIVENQAGIPQSLAFGHGNESDKQGLAHLIGEFIKQLQTNEEKPLVVADAGWYSAENVAQAEQEGILFVTHVPATLSLCQELLAKGKEATFQPLKAGYEGYVVERTYGGVAQRWLVVASEEAYTRARKTVMKQLAKKTEEEMKGWEKLCRQAFACKADAEKAVQQFQKKCHYAQIESWERVEQPRYAQAGRPMKNRLPESKLFFVSGILSFPLTCYRQELDRHALFILATNQLENDTLSPLDILESYQGQNRVERGFRFLKDPFFMLNTIFLKKVERVMAVMMVMTLCLVVYAALEYRIRQTLQENQLTIPDQKGRPTAKPTARWVFQLFMDVVLLTISHPHDPPQTQCLNLKPALLPLLSALGAGYAEIYRHFRS